MEILNPFGQIYNELLLYTMLGEIEWLTEDVGDDIIYKTNWLEHNYELVWGDSFISVYDKDNSRFTVYLAEHQSNQLAHVISNKNFDWNLLPRRI